MRAALHEFRAVTGSVTVTDAQRLEIARLEIARVSTLGIAGFDDVVTYTPGRLNGLACCVPSTTSHSANQTAWFCAAVRT